MLLKQRQQNSKSSLRELVITGLMTALLCIISPLSIPLGFSPVPITFSTFAIYLSLIILGKRKGIVSCLIYLLLGMIGLPVFSGFVGGFHRLFGPTGGYLVGYLFLAIISGFFLEKFWCNRYLCFLGMLLGTLFCYLFGTIWLCLQLNVGFVEGLFIGVIPYIPADLVKIVLALLAGIPLRRTLLKASVIS